MHRLDGLFAVLENDFKEVMKWGWQHRCSYECRATRGNGLDGIKAEDSRDVKVISKLQWGVRVNIGGPVKCVTQRSIYQRCWISQYNCLCWYYLSIMEWALWIRPGCICCQIPPVTKTKFKIIKLNHHNLNSNKSTAHFVWIFVYLKVLACCIDQWSW